MENLKRTLRLMAFCAVALFGANDAEAVSSGADARMLLGQSAELLERMGFPEEANQSREQIAIVSDDELFDVYRDVDLERLVLAQAEAVEAMDRANHSAKVADQVRREAANRRSASKGGDPGKDLQDPNLPPWDQSAVLGTWPEPGDGASNIANWNMLRDWRISMRALFNGLQIARDAVPICEAAGMQIVAGGGIGVCLGGNASSACLPVGTVVQVLQLGYSITKAALNEMLAIQEKDDYRGYRLDQARTDLVYQRSEYLNDQLLQLDQNLADWDKKVRDQLQLHDDDIKNQLEQHDQDIKNQLAIHDQDIKIWLLRLQTKANLALKTQLQNMMTNNGGARALMSYTERLDEVCRLAEESITNATNAGYRVHARAQPALDRGLALKDSDPKKAHDECRDAFQYAVSRSPHRLPGYGGRR